MDETARYPFFRSCGVMDRHFGFHKFSTLAPFDDSSGFHDIQNTTNALEDGGHFEPPLSASCSFVITVLSVVLTAIFNLNSVLVPSQEDSLSFLNHQDIALWTSSVSESQDFGSFSHQDSLQEFIQAADITLPGTVQPKEDNDSDLSSMEDSAYMSQPDTCYGPSRSDVNSTAACLHSTIMATDYGHPLAIDAMALHSSGPSFLNRHMMSVSSDSSFPAGSVDFARLTNGTTPSFDPTKERNAKTQLTADYPFSPSDLVFGDLEWEARSNQMIGDSITMQELDIQAMQQSQIAPFQNDVMDPYTLQDNIYASNRTNYVSGVIQQLPILSVEQRKSQTSAAPPVQTLYKSGPYVPIRPQVQPNTDRIHHGPEAHLLMGPRRDSLPGSAAIRIGTNKGTFQGDRRNGHGYSLSSNHTTVGTNRAGETHDENSRRASLNSISGVTGHLTDEAESKAARTHPLYSVGPREDGLYHCSFERSESCGHKPTKLKCNYDKYIDSHLRPFRCKDAACADTPFSSAACLLRHEREAHRMHGAEPHLCYYAGCDRSVPGNGFPRKYNLYDHMRRVHEHTEPMTPDHASPPAMSNHVAVQPLTRQPRRRRNSKDVEKQSDRKSVHGVSKSIDSGRVSAVRVDDARLRRKKQLQDDWTQRLAFLRQNVGAIEGPQDASSLQMINESTSKLNQLAQEMDKLP